MRKLIAILSAAILVIASSSCGHTLFEAGASDYSIVVGDEASASEKWAAEELQHWISEVGGVELPIVGTTEGCKGKRIVVGFNELTASAFGTAPQEHSDESFTYRNRGGDIFIWGGADRGTQYGVFTFLENELGCRWYTSKVSLAPHRDSWKFGKLYDCESPGIKVRNTFYLDAFDPTWSARNKNNSTLIPQLDADSAPGTGVGYYGCHTFGQYVPAWRWFDTHPEYFSEIDGRRVAEESQLCLSNPEVLQLCIDGIRTTMRNHPEYLIFDMSQNDNVNPCQCEKCRALKEQYGGESGAMIWFVNQVADAVKDEFPDKYVGTFAYQYTRTPPTGIVPRDNVVVRLCSIECCFLHPFDDPDCQDNVAFMSDLETWGTLAPNLYIWDYVATFNQYLAPFPNVYSLQPNIRILRDHNAIGIMEQGDYQSIGAAFGELKTYLISKLLWNPEIDVESVIDDFIKGYYGPAASRVREYFDLENSLRGPDVHMGCFNDCNHPIFRDDVILQGISILETAMDECKDDQQTCSRLRLLASSPYYMFCVRNPREAKSSGYYYKLQEIIEEWHIDRIAEWGGHATPGDFYWYICQYDE